MIKQSWNQITTIILCVLASLYFWAGMDAEFHWVSIHYAAYINNVELKVSLMSIILGLCLVAGSIHLTFMQTRLNQQKETSFPAYILCLQLGLFILVGLDLQFLQFLQPSTLTDALLIIGFISAFAGFYKNRKLVQREWDCEYV